MVITLTVSKVLFGLLFCDRRRFNLKQLEFVSIMFSLEQAVIWKKTKDKRYPGSALKDIVDFYNCNGKRPLKVRRS